MKFSIWVRPKVGVRLIDAAARDRRSLSEWCALAIEDALNASDTAPKVKTREYIGNPKK